MDFYCLFSIQNELNSVLCAGHGASVMGCKSPVGRDVRNHESEATAAPRGVVGRKPETRPWDRRTETGYKACRHGVREQWIPKPDTHSDMAGVNPASSKGY